MMLVFHDDAEREYAYGPASGLPDTKFGRFLQSLTDEANNKGWVVISMKNDRSEMGSDHSYETSRDLNSEPQNIEQRTSNFEGWFRYA